MIEIFLRPEALAFSIALTVVFGLFLLEILSLMLGGSLMAIGSDGPDVNLDFDVMPDADFDMDIDMPLEVDAPDSVAVAPSGLSGWLGMREVPFLIWLVSFLTLFGLSGLVLQAGVTAFAGAPLSGWIAGLVALAPAVFGARGIARVIAAIMPKTESSAMRTRFLGGHYGIISQGTARRGKPAEAKIKDRFGNTHYLRVEPLGDSDVIPQGRDVRVIRKKNGMFFVVDIT